MDTSGHHQISVNWTTVTGATGYYLYKSLTPGGETHPPLAQLPCYYGSFTDTNVVGGRTYYYTLTSLDTRGESGPSVEFSATPGEGIPAPTVTATPHDGSVSLSWLAVAGATGYAAFATNGGLLATSTSPGFVQSNLGDGNTYYTVDAVNKNAGGLPANVSATPQKRLP